MIRFLFRFLATILLAIAVVMAVIDATRIVAAGDWVMTPLGASWMAVLPDALDRTQAALAAIHPGLWDPLMLGVLKAPGFIVFAMLAFLSYAIGRKPARRLDPFAQRV